MIIDFHTHTFPVKMVDKTIRYLEDKAQIKAYHRGTNETLLASMEEVGVTTSVLLPVVTSPLHTKTINDLAVLNNQIPGFISFGGIHPDSVNYKEELTYIKEQGLLGIKIHPDYQNCYFDDPRYIRIIDEAFALGLIVVTHAGIDTGYTDVKCHTKAIINVLNSLKNKGVLILAHMGGVGSFAETVESLKGYDVYFDLAFCLGTIMVKGQTMALIKEEELKKFIETFGVERILFATDSPWGSQKLMVEELNKMDLSIEQKEAIFFKNALRILKK